jgi:hypothetical protein
MNRLWLAAALLVGSVSPVNATFTIQVNYSGDPAYAPYFAAAASTWQTLLVGYQNGGIQAISSGSSYAGVFVGDPLTTVFIDADVSAIDGPGLILGSAGPTAIALDLANYILTTDGEMQFDSADAANLVTAGLFDDVVMHEMAHVLGFGTLWGLNGVYNSGTGEFLGANATAYWQSEFGQTGTPDVELAGGAGTADAHWNENTRGAGLTGISSIDGDMRNELMTGWLNSPTFISDMTIASFVDIGFIGSLAAIPEPSSFFAMGLVFAGLGLKRRRVAV